MESAQQLPKYMLTIPGGLEYEFNGDITTSAFLKNMRADMEDTGDIIDLRECPCEFSNMSPAESLRFIKLWESVSIESGKKMLELLEPRIVCLNPNVLDPISELIKSSEQDMVTTDEYIITEHKKRSVELTPEDIAGIKQCKSYHVLTENITLPTLYKFIRLSNFLDIPALLKLFSYLIAKAMRAFTSLNMIIKPIQKAYPEPLDQELD